MKIHGTAKGGALSTKDFGVAFGGAAAEFDDTGLKVYWKFNEPTGSSQIDNVSESDDSLGSDGDLIMTGGTYEQTAVGDLKAVLFNGSSDFGVVSSGSNTLSQFNFLHEGSNGSSTGQSTICFWMKLISSVNYGIPIDNTAWTMARGIFLLLTTDAGSDVSTITQNLNNGSASIVSPSVGGSHYAYIPDLTDYYFYVIRTDVDITTDACIWTRDNANEYKVNRLNTPVDGNSSYVFNIGKKANALQYFANMEISEMSIFNRILTSDEMNYLFNDGEGRAIY